MRTTKKCNRIKLPVSDVILKAIATLLTVFWILCLFFPIYWMVSSSFKDSSVQYKDPPEFSIAFPDKYTIQIDYSDIKNADEYLDSNLMLWRMFGVVGANIGQAEIITTSNGKAISSYTLTKSSYQINRKQMWTKSILLASDIESAIDVIKDENYVVKSQKAQFPKKQYTNEYTNKMLKMFSKDDAIVGKVTSVTYCKSPKHFFENYKIAWNYPSSLGIESGLAKPIFNTLFIAFFTFSLSIFISSIAAYAISKLLPRGIKGKVMIIIMLSGMIPSTVTLLSKYQIVQNLGLADSFWGIILPGIASFSAMLLFKGTFDAFPDSIIEAARLDGCNEIKVYLKFVLPSATAVIGVEAITVFASCWNSYFWPMMVLRDENKYTVALVLNVLLNGGGGSPDYSTTLALGFLISIPTLLIYALFQKTLTYGMDFSGLKG